MSPDPDLTPDDLVGALTDGGQIHDVDTVDGFVGHSQDDMTRIYLDDALRTFINVPTEAIKHRLKLDDPASVAPRSRLWIDRAALDEPVEQDQLDQLDEDFAGQFGAGRLGTPTKGEYSSITPHRPGWPHWPFTTPWCNYPGIRSRRATMGRCCDPLP
jgi:hypothetical protein